LEKLREFHSSTQRRQEITGSPKSRGRKELKRERDDGSKKERGKAGDHRRKDTG